MPPRRSTRSVSAAKPTPPTSSARPSRRKASVVSPETSEAGSDAAPAQDDSEDEVPVKRPARKAAAPKKSVSAASTRSRRTTRATSTAASTPEPTVAEADEEEEEDDDDEEPVKPVRKPASRGKAAAKPAVKSASARSRKKVVISDAESDDGVEEDEDTVKQPSKVAPQAAVAKAESPDSSEDELEDLIPPSRSAKSAVTSTAASVASTSPRKAASQASASPADSDSEEDDLLDETPRKPVESDSDEDDLLRESTPKLAESQTPKASRMSRLNPDGTLLDIPSQTMPGTAASALPPKTPARVVPFPSLATPLPAAAPAPPKPRLTIHKLVLNNFKSYGGRQEIGPFHKSFSAIVGPNGSGKSNTIDALLFVFGFRATKMRQGKLSELIHNSASFQNLQECSVEVWFREIVDLPGVDNFLLVPNSELNVARTAFKNNTSKYTVNGVSKTREEVVSLLKGKGIDLDHNRFLILQGEVESIALMKPKAQTEHEDGLLEYLEDIIGTTEYKPKIEAASELVEKFNDERGEKLNRLRVVEREKSSLEEKKREAEEFLRDQNELVRKRSMLWQAYMLELKQKMATATEEIEQLSAELTAKQESNAHILAEIEEKQKAYEETLASFKTAKSAMDALSKDAKRVEKEELGFQEKRKHLVTKQKKLAKSVQDDGHTRSAAKGTIKNCEEEIEANKSKVADLERKLEVEEAELEEVRDSLKDKTDEFTTEIDAKQRELEPWTAKISEKQSAIDVARSERDLLAQKATSAESALTEAQEGLKAAQEGEQAKRVEHKSLKKELSQAQGELADAEAKLQSMATRSDALRSKVSVSRQKADEAKSSLAADKSENAVLASLNKLKAQGRLKGFHGRLGDLGVIDDKYDVAVTTAAPALNNLVVDTVEQGQACIEHLRKNNIGRASILVLEKLPKRDLSAINTPEKAPRLFDLIKPKEEKFAPAFFKAVTNTLVADDLQQAQRIGYGAKRWRVVTLAGQLIDPSGTMSGGGSKVSRGGMSSKLKSDKVDPEVVARYEKESAAAEQELTDFQSQKRTAEQEVTQLRKRIPEIEMQLEKIELDIKTSAKRIAEAERRIEELSSQSKPNVTDMARIKSLDSEIASLTKDADKLRTKSSAISDQIKELQDKIMEVGGVKLRAIQSKYTTTKGLLDLANEAITRAEVGHAKAIHDVEKMDKAIKANTAKLEEVEAELEVIENGLQERQSELALISENVQRAQDSCTDIEERLAESKTELDDASGEITAFRKFEMSAKQKIELCQREEKDNQQKYKHWAKRHEELQLNYVDDDDDDEEEGDEQKTEAPVVKAETEDEEGEPKDDGEDEEQEQVEKPQKRARDNTLELVEYSPEDLQEMNKEYLKAEIAALEEEIARAKPNLNVLQEYRKREAEFLDRAKDLEMVTTSRDEAKQLYDDLRKVRLDEFMAGFSAISAKLKEMYQMITMGGNAEIELVDTMDPFSEGVVLSIMPPKKSWRPIANLSGGEKTLASLALVFALHVFKPTPLYFMDEIDAALDFKNVSIVANYIQSKTQAAQFIVISLRNDMFELAHRLVGIYKTNNCTKSIAIDNKDLRTQAVRKQQVPPTPRGTATPLPNGVPSTPGTVLARRPLGSMTALSPVKSVSALPSTPTPLRTAP